MAFLYAYFDETGESLDPTQRINGMAGFLAPTDIWKHFNQRWSHTTSKDFHDKEIRGLKRKELARSKALTILEDFDLLPIGWVVDMELWNTGKSLGPKHPERITNYRIFSEPYYRAYDHCLRMSVSVYRKADTPTAQFRPEVMTVFGEKMVFAEYAITYYKYWQNANPQHARLALAPLFAPAQIEMPPLRAADCIAGILRDEFIRRLTRPKDVPLDSYERVKQMAHKALHGNVSEHVPITEVARMVQTA